MKNSESCFVLFDLFLMFCIFLEIYQILLTVKIAIKFAFFHLFSETKKYCSSFGAKTFFISINIRFFVENFIHC